MKETLKMIMKIEEEDAQNLQMKMEVEERNIQILQMVQGEEIHQMEAEVEAEIGDHQTPLLDPMVEIIN